MSSENATDASPAILQRYADRLAWSVSERDHGQYDAINKGFARSTGEIMAWLNSDDLYPSWTLSVVAEIFAAHPQIQWITSAYPMLWDARGRAVSCGESHLYSRAGFQRGENLPGKHWHSTGWIQQESTFWRRSLWDAAGGKVDAGFRMAGDFDLWARFFQHAELYAVGTPLGGFRMHGQQKTSHSIELYYSEALESLKRNGGRPASAIGSVLRSAARYTPKPLRKPGAAIGLTRAHPVCRFDFASRQWKASYLYR